MKKLIIISLTLCLVFIGFAFLILFEASFDKTFNWWSAFSRDNEGLPYSPYKIRREDSAKIRIDEANQVKFIDDHIFWKGKGAIALPEITKDGKLVKLIMNSKGNGYSENVKAVVTGSMGNAFELGQVKVENGEIHGVEIVKTSIWHSSPKLFWGEEELPFSGTIEKRFPNGQILTQNQYLSGEMHGKSERFNESGIPIYSKDYKKGLKHGTHIYWFSEPMDPESYIQIKYETLWSKILEEAKEKFGTEYGKQESNKWIVENYKLDGGSFQVRLLEHWENNQKHGLFEGFDRFGNKTFKDEYKSGLRIKHRTFDKTKTKSFDRRVEKK